MRKLVAAINMTLDGFGEHTAIDPDQEIHQHYADLLKNSGTLLYGRVTYHLMENYWPNVVTHPTGNKATDDFAVAISNIDKIVFSRTLQTVHWKNASIATREIEAEVLALKQQPGGDILAGSPGLIIDLLNRNLVDEFQLCVHPVILGNGTLPLMKNITRRINLTLPQTKIFSSGAVLFCYAPVQQ